MVSLLEFYESVARPIQAELISCLPRIANHYPARIVLPESDREFSEATGLDLSEAEREYGFVRLSESALIFSPRHQQDFRRVAENGLDISDLPSVDALETVVHEIIHLSALAGYARNDVGVVLESATELAAMSVVLGTFGGSRQLLDSLRRLASPPDMFPRFTDLLIVLGNVRERLMRYLSLTAEESFLDMTHEISAVFGVPPELVARHLVSGGVLDEVVSDRLNESAGRPVGDSTRWLLESTYA